MSAFPQHACSLTLLSLDFSVYDHFVFAIASFSSQFALTICTINPQPTPVRARVREEYKLTPAPYLSSSMLPLLILMVGLVSSKKYWTKRNEWGDVLNWDVLPTKCDAVMLPTKGT